ncbi:hypothetical protein ABZ477_13385 [Microbacterium sp. NPDC019599]|uniref:hypothetical protein n=1 Tax=Microbacterium sp. NPDC019599 TaxID=3154690 RepID=UPI0034024F21
MRAVLVVPVLALLTLTGCVPIGFACPAIGYTSVAHVTLAEPQPGLTLQLCDGEGCEPGPPMQPVEIASPGATAEPVLETGVFEITGDSATGWTAVFSGGQPVIGYRLLDKNGMTVTQGGLEVEWVRVGGDERCGGPREAEIELPV